MTGFARADGEGLGISWTWEVKSVNGKSLDLRLRLVPGFDALEPQLRAMVAQRFRRGNFSANLAVTRISPAAVRINRETLTQLLRLMNELAAEIEAAPPRLDGLLALRGVVETVDDEDDEVLEKRRFAVLDGWATALDQLAMARAEEGARLAALLQSQLEELTALVAAAEGCAAAQPAAIRERLLKMLASLTDLVSGIPEERVAQEMAMLVTRSDVRRRPSAGFPLSGIEPRSQHAVCKIGRYRPDPHRAIAEGRGRAVSRAGAEHRMMIRRRGFLLVLSDYGFSSSIRHAWYAVPTIAVTVFKSLCFVLITTSKFKGSVALTP